MLDDLLLLQVRVMNFVSHVRLLSAYCLLQRLSLALLLE